MFEKWKNMTLNNKTGFLLKVLLVLCLIPMLYIARYAFMGADDYSYSIETVHTWNNTHSIIQVLLTVISLLKKFYTTWQGSYTCIFLCSFHPCIFGSGEHFYWVNCILLILMLCFSMFYACRVIIGDVYKRKDVADIAACIMLLICLETLPHANQAFYWWNGAANYVPFFCLLIILTANYFRTIHNDKCSLKRCIVLCMLGFISAGGNYVMSLLCVEVSILYVMLAVYMSRKIIVQSLAVMFTSAFGLVISLMSPGNLVRVDSYEDDPMGLMETVKRAIDYGIGFVRDSNGILVILCLLILVPFIAQIKIDDEEYSKLDKINIAVTAALFLLILSSSFAPTLYIERTEGPRRAQNVRYFFFIFEAVLSELLVILKIKRFMLKNHKLHAFIDENQEEWRRFSGRYLCTVGIMLILMVLYYIVPSSNRSYFTSASALKVLRSGDARAYGAEVRNRYDLIHADDMNIEVPDYTVKPSLVYYVEWDITDNPDDWKNTAMSDFYEKDSIVRTGD